MSEQASLRFGDKWQQEAGAIAARLVPNGAFSRLASQVAASTPYALDYLTQAPVLVLAASFGRPQTGREMSYAAWTLAERIKAKPKLRDLMGSVRVAYGFRALKGSVLCPSRSLPIFALSQTSDLHPSALAQAIPPRSREQTIWLRALLSWSDRMARRQRGYGTGLAWAAVAAGAAVRTGPIEMGDLADFYMADPACFNPKWSFDQAKAAADRWHRELGKKKGEAEFYRRHGVGFSELIDFGDLPLEAEVGAFRFIALNSGEELFAEGAAMHHCVGTYSADVLAGHARMFSLRLGERRVATLDLRQKRRCYEIAQLKGPCNAAVLKPIVDAATVFVEHLNRRAAA